MLLFYENTYEFEQEFIDFFQHNLVMFACFLLNNTLRFKRGWGVVITSLNFLLPHTPLLNCIQLELGMY